MSLNQPFYPRTVPAWNISETRAIVSSAARLIYAMFSLPSNSSIGNSIKKISKPKLLYYSQNYYARQHNSANLNDHFRFAII